MKKIDRLVARIPNLVWVPGAGKKIEGLSADSRTIEKGWLFAALQGAKESGGRFVADALKRGAHAVLHDGSATVEEGVTQLIHPNPRAVLSLLADRFYDFPGRKMALVAVTGSNGKTTVAAMVESILNACGHRVGVIGTTGSRWPGVMEPPGLTTPDPVTLRRTLAAMARDHCTAAVLETSSHALDQWRVLGLPFVVGIFTNLSRDHLDYHGGMDSYFAAKRRLFTHMNTRGAAVNVADSWGRRLLAEIAAHLPVNTFGGGGEFSAHALKLGWDKSLFELSTPAGKVSIRMPMAGAFNVDNALAAAAGCWVLGARGREIRRGLRHLAPVPGRMRRIDAGQPFSLVVDFAHTPEGLERLLFAARALTRGRLVVLFGCGGDRDRGKRPMMGQVAARMADRVIISDDNPRSEDPAVIRREIMAGCQGGRAEVVEVPGRWEAIVQALGEMKPKDALLIAGKGHEAVQIVGEEVFPFDDAKVAMQALADLGFGQGEQWD